MALKSEWLVIRIYEMKAIAVLIFPNSWKISPFHDKVPTWYKTEGKANVETTPVKIKNIQESSVIYESDQPPEGSDWQKP